MLLSQILVAGTKLGCGLQDCAKRELGLIIDKTEQTSDWSGPLTDSQLAYAARDAAILLPLHDALTAKAQAAGLGWVAEIERRCLPAIVWMSSHGVPFDSDRWRQQARHAEIEAAVLSGDLNRTYGSRNWNSPQQVTKALAEAGCIVKDTRDETLASVDHPLADLIRKHRLARKRSSSFGKKWLGHVAADGRIHPRWRQIGAESGRMSCSSPNIQQLPRGDYRRCVAAPHGRVFVKLDYSQIELRIGAKESCDANLLAAFQAGEDLHVRTARSVLGVTDVTKADRQVAKALNFGLLFGMGATGFRQYARSQYQVELSDGEASRHRSAFFAEYPGLAAWHRRVKAGRAQETRTLAGRRRLLTADTPDTQRLNSPIQGTGADGLKLALALLWERRGEVPGAFPVMAVHDEIVVECDAAQAQAAADWLTRAMTDAMTPLIDPVPVKVEVSVGETWAG
jgi:DNA polymerase-1